MWFCRKKNMVPKAHIKSPNLAIHIAPKRLLKGFASNLAATDEKVKEPKTRPISLSNKP
jgi:hypothetical protein